MKALGIHKLPLHREDPFAIPGGHFLRATTAFGHIAGAPPFKAQCRLRLNKDRQLEKPPECNTMEEPEPFKNHDGPGLDEYLFSPPGMGRKVVGRHGGRTPAGEMFDHFSKSSPIQRLGIVKIHFGALGGRQMREILIEGVLANDCCGAGPEVVEKALRKPGFAASAAPDDSYNHRPSIVHFLL